MFRTNNIIRKIVIKLYIKFKIAHSDMFYECWVAEQVKFGEHFIRSTYGDMTLTFTMLFVNMIIYKYLLQSHQIFLVSFPRWTLIMRKKNRIHTVVGGV